MRVEQQTHLVVFIGLLLIVCNVCADMYLHYPRGSNNKLNEVANNVQNENRLFDSQNNGNAGYQVGDNCDPVCSNSNGGYDNTLPGAAKGKPYFYAGSVLYVEWTVQHSCSSPNAHCEVILQYSCDDSSPGMRDGVVTTTIPENVAGSQDTKYGQHETYQYYQKCKARERNRGLFLADQFTNRENTLRSAINTRQNRNGQRYGFECPEERDYYPYWHPSPWRDVAVFTDNPLRCAMYQEQSQNVRNKGECSLPQYNQQETCEAGGGVWTETGSFNTAPPDCQVTKWQRDNHHGNTLDGQMWSYNWTVSDAVISESCVLRVRYNISTGDYDGWTTDSSSNNNRSPVTQDLTADFIGLGNTTGPLRLAIDTAQYGRVFEDRSHTFSIRRMPSLPLGAVVYNVGVRGRRGNIQQVAPVVEYDYAPNKLTVKKGDYIHFQFVGSDANPPGNAGEGRRMTDRSNLVQIASLDDNIPVPITQHTLFTNGDGADMQTVGLLARLNQTNCDENSNNDQDIRNCKYLNAAPGYFDGGLVRMNSIGSHYYMNTRNNNFSNRSQKGVIIVTPNWALIGGIIGGVGGFLVALTVTLLMMRRHIIHNPTSSLALGCCGVCLLGRRRYNQLIAANAGETQTNIIPGKRCVVKFDYEAADSDELTVCMDDIVYMQGEATEQGWAYVILDKGGKAGFVPVTYIEEAKPTGPPRPASGIKPRARSMQKGKVRMYWERNKRNVIFMLIYAVINIILYLYFFLAYLGQGPIFLPLAKGCGMVLNFNCVLILFPVMRNLLSWLRSTPVGGLLSLDDNIQLHKIVASVIAVFAILHTIFHYLDFVAYRALLGLSIQGQAFGNLAGVTGHLLWLLMIIMFITALEFVRSRRCCGRGGYDVFWLFHHLYIPVLLIMLIHSPRFWMWVFFPGCLMIIEKLIRYQRGAHPLEVLRVVREASDVIRIEFKKRDFHYKSGQYMYINCQEVSPNEWHPFTITSAPEESVLSVHIRCRGDWTQKLRKFLNPEDHAVVQFATTTTKQLPFVVSPHARSVSDPKPLASPKTTARASPRIEVKSPEMPMTPLLRHVLLRVDGPYGAASEHVFQHRTVMLVGTGIGVTPFASVMKSIRLRARAAICCHCGKAPGDSDMPHVSIPGEPDEPIIKPQKVHFYWLCRDEQEFSWFKSLLQGIENDKKMSGVFEFNTFLTGEIDLQAIIAKHKENDAFKITYAGRPNWRRIFKQMQQQYPKEEVGVFLCGPPQVADELADSCRSFSQPNGTRFTFRKENF